MSLHLRQNLNVRMEQRLKLTPQMIQSIEILLLPQMALEERIMHEVEANPALEIADESGDGVESAAEASGEIAQMDPSGQLSRDDREWLLRRKNSHQDDDGPDKMEALASAPEREKSLADHLLEQLRFTEMPPEVKATLEAASASERRWRAALTANAGPASSVVSMKRQTAARSRTMSNWR